MNNNRLSTSGKPLINRTKLNAGVTKLLSMPSNYKVCEDGRTWINSEGRYLSSGKSEGVQIIYPCGTEFKSFNSVTACAVFLGIPQPTLTYKLKHNKPVLFENKLCIVKKFR